MLHKTYDLVKIWITSLVFKLLAASALISIFVINKEILLIIFIAFKNQEFSDKSKTKSYNLFIMDVIFIILLFFLCRIITTLDKGCKRKITQIVHFIVFNFYIF